MSNTKSLSNIMESLGTVDYKMDKEMAIVENLTDGFFDYAEELVLPDSVLTSEEKATYEVIRQYPNASLLAKVLQDYISDVQKSVSEIIEELQEIKNEASNIGKLA